MKARFRTQCSECGGMIEVDDEITRDTAGGWLHETCPEVIGAQIHGTVCPIHHVERALDGSCERCE